MTILSNDFTRFLQFPVRIVRKICGLFESSYLLFRDRMDRQSRSSPRVFNVVVTASQAVGILVVVLVALWMSHYRGGFAWSSNPSLEFNYHPVLMTIGLIFLYAEAIIIYRVFAKYPKGIVKAMHGVIQAIALLFTVVGLKAVLDSHNLPAKPIPNFYSMHSWLGLLTIGLFILQLVAGFAILVWPGGTDAFRKAYMDNHRFFGIAIFCLACATALTGTVEKTLFTIKDVYSKLPPEAYVINFFGISIVVFACLIVFIATKSDWKRTVVDAPPERESLLSRD